MKIYLMVTEDFTKGKNADDKQQRSQDRAMGYAFGDGQRHKNVTQKEQISSFIMRFDSVI